MKFIIFFIYVGLPLVSSGTHTFITTYTAINDQTDVFPKFVAISSLDGHQMDYYDSDTMKLIPKQPWMKEFASEELCKEYTEIRKQVQQIHNINISDLMERFSQSGGVHTYQRRYGCDYDDETGDSRGFDEYGYDGEDFISMNLTEGRYTARVAQAMQTVEKWNNDTAKLEFLKQYYEHQCVYWLKELLKFSEAVSKITTAPEVSLLQKDPSSPIMCHATGFYPSEVTITWFRNRQVHDEDVDLGELLPNEDGTFQKTSTLHVTLYEWKKNQYACEVEHQGKTFRKILTVDEINKTKV